MIIFFLIALSYQKHHGLNLKISTLAYFIPMYLVNISLTSLSSKGPEKPLEVKVQWTANELIEDSL